MKAKRLLSAMLLSVMFLLPLGTGNVLSRETGERVTVIVEVSGDAVLATRDAILKGAGAYTTTRAAARVEENALRTQAAVQEAIDDAVSYDTEAEYTYTYLLNGFSMEIDAADIDKIKALPNVEEVWIAEDILLDDPLPGDAEEVALAVDNCCEMMGTDAAHAAGYRGEGMAIAVIDSEFDLGHEFFSTVPDDLTKVKYTKADIGNLIAEQNLNMDVSANQVYRSAKIPYAYNYAAKNADTYSSNQTGWHGTHVAGIAAGKNGALPNGEHFDGVAPEAQLLLMSASSNGGNILNSAAAVAAIDDAAKLGADAINLSFGTAYGYNDSAKTKAVNAARSAGIFVATSSGNAGRGFDMDESVPVGMIDYASSGTPANASGATGVASATNTRVWQSGPTVCLPGEDPVFVRDIRNFLTEFPAGSTISYVYCGQGTAADFAGVDATNRVALILRGNGTFNDKVTRAAAAGAAGVILMNNVDTDANPMVTVEESMPVGWINHYSDGAALLQNGGALTVGEGVERRAYQEAVSPFSSWGTNASLDLKPEIMTPGQNIYSSYPNDAYALLSGTSMAAPHAAGAAALLNQYVGEALPGFAGNRAALVENLMMSTATQVTYPGTSIPYSPRAQGAGLLNLAAAIQTPVIFEGSGGKSKVNLGEIGDSFTLSFDAVNLTGTAATYDTVSLSVLTDDYTVEDGENVVALSRLLAHTVTSAPESVTVPANGREAVSIRVSLDAAELAANREIFQNGFFVEGYLTLSDSTDTLPALHIPYTGFYGGWTTAPILDAVGGVSGKTKMTLSLGGNLSILPGQNPVLAWMKANDPQSYATYESSADRYDGAAYAAWSPNGDAVMDTLSGNLYFLRTASNVKVTATDGQGTTETVLPVSGNQEKYSEKAFAIGGDGGEGAYTFTAKGCLVGRNSLAEQAFPLGTFTEDVTAPEVTGYQVTSENDAERLTVSLTDNHFVAGVILTGEDENHHALKRYYPVLPDSEAEITMDVSDFSSFTAEAYDYAGNKQVIKTGIFVTATEVTEAENGACTHAFTLLNTTREEPSAWCAAALYQNEKMVGFVQKNVTVSQGVSRVEVTLPDTPYTARKVFLWNNKEEMIPIVTE